MKIETSIPILGFAAYSGTGKTTLLVNVIPLLKQAGYRAGVIKHAHHSFELRKAGAEQMLIGSKTRWALMVEEPEEDQETRLATYISRLDQDTLDIILVEGFKPEAIDKIELHRPSLGHPFIAATDNSVVAIASDEQLEHEKLPRSSLAVLDLNDHQKITRYIIEHYIK